MEKEMENKINSSMYQQCQKRGYATTVDVLMDLGVLSKQKYADWRFGRVKYLEQVCTINLRKLSAIGKQIRRYAQQNSLEPSFCCYAKWGKKKGNNKPLQFSKSGDPNIERWYATHYLDKKRIAELKKAAKKNDERSAVQDIE